MEQAIRARFDQHSDLAEMMLEENLDDYIKHFEGYGAAE